MSGSTTSNSPRGSGTWATWVAFAAIMMMLGGVFSVIGGFAAAFDDGYYVAASNANIYALSIQAIGVLFIIVGVVKVMAGWALIQGAEWARWVTILLCCFHAVVLMVMIPASPFFATLMIVINLVILYAVTVRWEEASIGMGN